MNIDKNLLASIAALDDAALAAAIRAVAASSGVDLSRVHLDAATLLGLRKAMQNATPEDLAKLQGVIEGFRK